MLLAVLLGEEFELALLGNVASGSQPLDGLEARLVRLAGHNATLVHHQIGLLEATRSVHSIAIHHHLARAHGRHASTTLHVVLASHVVLARHVVLATDTSIGHSIIIHGGVHVVLPKQHIFFKEGRIPADRKRTLLHRSTDPSLQPLYVRKWI